MLAVLPALVILAGTVQAPQVYASFQPIHVGTQTQLETGPGVIFTFVPYNEAGDLFAGIENSIERGGGKAKSWIRFDGNLVAGGPAGIANVTVDVTFKVEGRAIAKGTVYGFNTASFKAKAQATLKDASSNDGSVPPEIVSINALPIFTRLQADKCATPPITYTKTFSIPVRPIPGDPSRVKGTLPIVMPHVVLTSEVANPGGYSQYVVTVSARVTNTLDTPKGSAN